MHVPQITQPRASSYLRVDVRNGDDVRLSVYLLLENVDLFFIAFHFPIPKYLSATVTQNLIYNYVSDSTFRGDEVKVSDDADGFLVAQFSGDANDGEFILSRVDVGDEFTELQL